MKNRILLFLYVCVCVCMNQIAIVVDAKSIKNWQRKHTDETNGEKWNEVAMYCWISLKKSTMKHSRKEKNQNFYVERVKIKSIFYFQLQILILQSDRGFLFFCSRVLFFCFLRPSESFVRHTSNQYNFSLFFHSWKQFWSFLFWKFFFLF